MPRVKRPEYARINWRRLTAERNRKWEQMKQAFASEGIIGRPLWDSAPGFEPSFGQNAPRLFVLPLRPERGMVIVCAGGAFLFQSSNEAKPVAEFFHNAGLNAAVLEYRVKPYEVPAIPIQDGLRAVRFVRTYAVQWGIPQDKIAIGGFSAGGMLSAGVATHYDNGDPKARDPVDRASSRPDAVLLLYGVESPQAPERRTQAYDPDTARAVALQNPIFNLRPDSPPFFLFQTLMDDPHGALSFAFACADRGIPFELHTFPEGPHGCALYDGKDPDSPCFPHTAHWANLAAEWLKGYGF